MEYVNALVSEQFTFYIIYPWDPLQFYSISCKVKVQNQPYESFGINYILLEANPLQHKLPLIPKTLEEDKQDDDPKMGSFSLLNHGWEPSLLT